MSLSPGIGASTALFSIVYGALMRPLPYPNSDQLVRLGEFHQGATAGPDRSERLMAAGIRV